MVLVRVVREDISIDKVVEEMIKENSGKGCGALAIFIGFVKDIVNGARVYSYGHVVEDVDKVVEELYEILDSEVCDDVPDARIYFKIGEYRPSQILAYVFVIARDRHKAIEKLYRIIDRFKKETSITSVELRENGRYVKGHS